MTNRPFFLRGLPAWASLLLLSALGCQSSEEAPPVYEAPTVILLDPTIRELVREIVPSDRLIEAQPSELAARIKEVPRRIVVLTAPGQNVSLGEERTDIAIVSVPARTSVPMIRNTAELIATATQSAEAGARVVAAYDTAAKSWQRELWKTPPAFFPEADTDNPFFLDLVSRSGARISPSPAAGARTWRARLGDAATTQSAQRVMIFTRAEAEYGDWSALKAIERIRQLP